MACIAEFNTIEHADVAHEILKGQDITIAFAKEYPTKKLTMPATFDQVSIYLKHINTVGALFFFSEIAVGVRRNPRIRGPPKGTQF